MAGKIKTKWICQNCGYESSGYLGKCPECSEFGSFCEEVISKENSSSKKPLTSAPITSINEIEIDDKVRILTKYEEFDRVLGGGFVQGSLVLLAGDPGIGKSTLILQACSNICKQEKKTLYVCAEESTIR